VPRADQAAADIPHVAPDAVVEVLSPGDRKKDVEEKIRVHLRCGTSVVFTVDTKQQTVTVREARGEEIIGQDAVVTHPSLPGFAMPARGLFEEP
jgi:Uma2 family endonuclease